MILKVSTQELRESFEYFECIPVNDNIKMIVTDIRNNSRHTLYQFIIRYEYFNKHNYVRGFGSLEDIINELNNVNERIKIWELDF